MRLAFSRANAEYSELTTSSFLYGWRGCRLNIACCAGNVVNFLLVHRHCNIIPRTYSSTCRPWKICPAPMTLLKASPGAVLQNQPVNGCKAWASRNQIDFESMPNFEAASSDFFQPQRVVCPVSDIVLPDTEASRFQWDRDHCFVLPWNQSLGTV
jgi:hypothetical protein